MSEELVQKVASLREIERILEQREKEITARIEANPLANFEPTLPAQCRFGQAQILFFQSKAKEKVLFGGNRSGKTHCAAVMTAFHITGRYPDYIPKEVRLLPGEERRRPLKMRIYAEDYKHGIGEIIWPKLMEVLPVEFRVLPHVTPNGEITGVVFPNGVQVSFMTYRQSKKSMAGWTGDLVWFDEPPPSREFYVEVIRGTVDRGGLIYVSATPLGSDWFDEYLLDNSTSDTNERFKVFSIQIDVRDNPHLPPEDMEWWVNRLPASDFQARVRGIPSSVASRVFLRYLRPAEHFIDPFPLPKVGGEPDGWNLIMALDPHDSHPAAMVWVAVFDPARTGGVPRIVQVAESWNPRTMTIAGAIEVAKEIEDALGAKPLLRVLDPNFGLKRSTVTGGKIIEEYVKQSMELGYPMRFVPGEDKISYGHLKLREWFMGRLPDGTPQFQIFKTCKATIQSLMRYRFKDPAKGVVENNKYKHFPDCLRYIATAKFRYRKQAVTQEEKAKEALDLALEEMRKPIEIPRLTVEERIRLNARLAEREWHFR